MADNIQSLAEAYATRTERNIALPFAIYNDDLLVGFIMIGKGTVGNEGETELIKNNYCLWRLMIDKKHQHQGLGTMAINKALSMMKNDEFKLGKAQYCWLSYEPENQLGKKLYNQIGFIENGEMCGNEIIAIYDLAK